MGTAISSNVRKRAASKYAYKGANADTGRSDCRSQKREWKVIPDHKTQAAQFVADGTLKPGDNNPDHIELRSILDDPVGQRYLGQYAKELVAQELFFCWIDIQEYKSIPAADYRRAQAKHIYEKYVQAGAVLCVGVLSLEERDEVKGILEKGKQEKAYITPYIFDKVQHKCFLDFHHNVFLRFKNTEKYRELGRKLKSRYNTVSTEDYDYMEKLGEGGFGRVVHVRKKSTQKHYAMKIQLKTALVETFSDDPTRLDAERTVFAACSHPYIVEMDYAFQTPAHAILVLGLVSAGDLQTAIDESKYNRLAETRVVLYAAEMVLALHHLHDLGLMYRDLKPCNVMLAADGHIKLADMGGVAEFADNTVLAPPKMGPDGRPVFDHILAGETTPMDSLNERGMFGQGIGNIHRRKSIMGTYGYMAPEMVKLMGQPRSERVGYSKAVDFWSLGVTIYKLMTGSRPFKRHTYQQFVEAASGRTPNRRDYEAILKQIYFPSTMSNHARDLVLRLLDADENTRLGCDYRGLDGLKVHPFFESIDWEKLALKHVQPQHKPTIKPLPEKPVYNNYDTMMAILNEEEAAEVSEADRLDWCAPPRDKDQAYFDRWDFISPHTLKVEMGIEQEMKVYDTNFKVRQLMGDDGDLAAQPGDGAGMAASLKNLLTPARKTPRKPQLPAMPGAHAGPNLFPKGP